MKVSSFNDRSKGVFFIIMSAFGFAMMSAFVKLSGDLPSLQKTFFRNIIAVLVAASMIIKNKDNFFGKKENQKLLILRSTLGTIGILFNFYAIDKLVLSDANMLNKLSPFFSIIFSTIFLKERMKGKEGIVVGTACTGAFIGALFIIKPSFNLQTIPALIGLLGGVSAAGAYTCVRALGNREKPNTIVFYFSFFSSIVTFPLMLGVYKPMSITQLLYLILAGVFASLGQFGITLAYKYAPAKEISIFDYTNIIFSAIISLVFFGVLPDLISIVGYIIIFLASFLIFNFNKKKDRKDKKQQ